MRTTPDPFTDSLFAEAPAADRCPHLQRDAAGPRCASPACQPGEDRLIVDVYALQLWCLAGPDRWPVCDWFREPPGATRP
jgi:hypothetical protein